MKRTTIETAIHAMFGIVAAALLVLMFWIIPSYFEARSYNRITGENVSTFDAMFVNLRVQASPKD